ncbi:hypothetical protein SAPIO_CDS0062 [Scedosporium apiospermum]|uniref:DUF676 domain-containing protein n=1 Tax=Pseudallescheria apiosperma TaxID=563466 RepID=A0A084GHG0_PSEDA|nr:uncharacterized protein SAPIO_CDS0062 [Scedosporium apiospermum]KEZ46772.1 hypothetical protein SAPIO_CDS0062 [Scedosporium apiospermum]
MENQESGGDLRVLYSPAADCPRPIDIIAVHGLNGDSMNTWTHFPGRGKPSTMWLRDLLPEKLPSSRVMTFQYDASVVGNTSAHGVRGNASKLLQLLRDKREDNDDEGRPIVFVGHSLGGIIIKQALKLASSSRRFSDIAKSTRGIVFFGTPHRGADGAKWLGLLTGIVSTALNQPQSKFIKLLETHSAELLKVSEDFRPLATKYAIVSFYEEHVDRILGKLVSSPPPPPPLANRLRHPQDMMVVFYAAM